LKVGLIAPVFTHSPRTALSVAQHADKLGLDGVFSYDHLFPIKSPDRPALSAIPLLAAMAVATTRVHLGTLVSRVTLLPLPVLVDALATLDEIAGGRVIAGIGTGDSLTAPENDAYGLPFPSVEERLHLLGAAARALRERQVTTWIGGRSRAVRAVAAADADAWNSWDGPLDELSGATWAGPPPPDGDFGDHLARLAAAGVTWAVYGPPPSTDWDLFVAKLAGAAEAVR
jgi:alkanesulfonate monooxygenase SsuD/methylene tetrahydromethanopterin reductase-like flavin-dependent oxidoreductase (luciferase family)